MADVATPLTLQEYKDLLLVQVSDNGTIKAILDTIWKDAALDTADLQAQYLRALLKAIDIRLVWLPKERSCCTTKEQRDNVDKLGEVLVGLQRNTVRALNNDSTVNSYVMGLIQKTAIIPPAPGWPDPMDPAYMGDPTRPVPSYPARTHRIG